MQIDGYLTSLPKSKDSQQIPDVHRGPQTMKMCVRLDEPATVLESPLQLRCQNQRTSFRWFQFRLSICYGFQGPSTHSSSPCGDLIRFRPLQRVSAQPCRNASCGSEANGLFLCPTPFYFIFCHLFPLY